MNEARRLAYQWKIKLFPEDFPRPLFENLFFYYDETSTNTILLLAGLVIAFRRDHLLVEQIRRHLEKAKLSSESSLADALAAYLPRIHAKLTPKQAYESKRRMRHCRVIEREYGGAVEAESRQQGLLLDPNDPVYGDFAAPTCLDDVFKGGRVNMLRLQELFGIERHQFPKKLPSISKGRETLYDYRAVVKIMDGLLSEDARKRPKGSGRPPRTPWLNDPERRTRVLSGIQARLNRFPVQRHFKAGFLAVVARHLPIRVKN